MAYRAEVWIEGGATHSRVFDLHGQAREFAEHAIKHGVWKEDLLIPPHVIQGVEIAYTKEERE